METALRLEGTGGPAGTSRPSALLPGIPATPSSSSLGAVFVREFEEANARLQDQAARSRRLDDRFSERRDARHEGVGVAREDATSASLAPVVVRATPAPPTVPAEVSAPEPTPVPTPALVGESSTTAGTPADVPDVAAPASTSTSSAPGPAVSVVASAAAPSSAATPATPATGTSGAPRPEVRAVEGAGRGEPAKASKAAAGAATARPVDTEAVERAQEILRQIKLHLAPGLRRLTLDLEPAALGRLAIQLTWRPGRLNAVVRAGEPATLELLREREDELRAVLAERGIQTDAMRFELGFDGRAPRRRAPAGAPAAAVQATARALARSAPVEQPYTHPPSGETLVDTYA